MKLAKSRVASNYARYSQTKRKDFAVNGRYPSRRAAPIRRSMEWVRDHHGDIG